MQLRQLLPRLIVCLLFGYGTGCFAFLFSGSSLPIHEGQLATRSIVPANFTTSFQYVQSRYAQIFRNYSNGFKIVIPCFYGGSESTTGANCEIQGAAVEYPVGVFTQVKFSGSATGTVTDGTYLISDSINIVVQKNDTVYIRLLMHNVIGIVTTNNIAQTAIGDGYECSVSALPNKTMGGTLSNTSCGGQLYVTVGIVGQSQSPSICTSGDSIIWGLVGSNAAGDRGYSRAIGSAYGYISMGINGQAASGFISTHTQRVALANAYCTHVIYEGGLPDIATGINLATLQSRLQTVWGYFTGRVYQTTYTPFLASSSPTCPANTGPLNSGQTTDPNEAVRVSGDDWIRTTPAGLAGFFEIADVFETTRNSGKWLTDGVTCQYTLDGVHPNDAGYDKILSDNAIPLSSFPWP